MGTVFHTKPTTTLAAFLDLEDHETPRPNCRCSTNSVVSLPTKPTLSRTARAIMFGMILIKKVGKRKGHHQENSDGQKRRLAVDSGSSSEKREVGGIHEENRDNQLVSLSSLSSGSAQSLPIPKSEPKFSNKKTSSGNEPIGVKQRNVDRSQRSCYALNSGVRLAVVSLVATVMQGRVIGILITSIWVYFFAWLQMEDRWVKKKATKFYRNRDDDDRRALRKRHC